MKISVDPDDELAAEVERTVSLTREKEKARLHPSQGLVSWERHQQIKSKIKELMPVYKASHRCTVRFWFSAVLTECCWNWFGPVLDFSQRKSAELA